MDISELGDEIRACTKCDSKLKQYGVKPRPIFSEGDGHKVILLGQAPGITEHRTGKPFQGDAGQSIRKLFLSCGATDFDGLVYQTSVTKCFPGRLPNATTDRIPSIGEVRNCSPFLKKQISLLRPKLLVCLGILACKAYAQMRELEEPGYCKSQFGTQSLSKLRMLDFVGKQFQWAQTLVIPMIHPAGTANGARALYPQQDIESKSLLRAALEEL